MSVTTSRRIHASALDLPMVPYARKDKCQLTEIISRSQVDAQLSYSSRGWAPTT